MELGWPSNYLGVNQAALSNYGHTAHGMQLRIAWHSSQIRGALYLRSERVLTESGGRFVIGLDELMEHSRTSNGLVGTRLQEIFGYLPAAVRI